MACDKKVEEQVKEVGDWCDEEETTAPEGDVVQISRAELDALKKVASQKQMPRYPPGTQDCSIEGCPNKTHYKNGLCGTCHANFLAEEKKAIAQNKMTSLEIAARDKIVGLMLAAPVDDREIAGGIAREAFREFKKLKGLAGISKKQDNRGGQRYAETTAKPYYGRQEQGEQYFPRQEQPPYAYSESQFSNDYYDCATQPPPQNVRFEQQGGRGYSRPGNMRFEQQGGRGRAPQHPHHVPQSNTIREPQMNPYAAPPQNQGRAPHQHPCGAPPQNFYRTPQQGGRGRC